VRSLLEKTITHLLNNEEEKAAALFHKFMVEKARQIHESLRQDEEIDLGEGWDNEIQEEEYFDDGDLATADDDHGDSMDDLENMNVVDDDGTDSDLDADIDADVDADVNADVDADVDTDLETMDPDDGGESVEMKIDALTAEFDRLMGALEDSGVIEPEDVDDDAVGDDFDADTTADGDEFEDMEGEEPAMDTGEADDLADRMDSDLGDDEKPESETMESADMDGDELDEDLADITESVLSELEKISSPSNTDGHEIGSGGKTIAGNRRSPLESHPVNDRISGAKPYIVKGGDNDSFEREEAPPRKPISTMVGKLRKNASRTSYKDGMSAVPKGGDASALINKDFAAGEAKSRPPIDGRMKPKTS
jgi:hypothetical protein